MTCSRCRKPHAGNTANCQACLTANALYRVTHDEAARHRAYRARRRAQALAQRAAARGAVLVLTFTDEALSGRLSMFPGCWVCGGPKEAVDHVKPIARGGPHILANLRPICTYCNSVKGARWPIDAFGVQVLVILAQRGGLVP